MWLDDPTKDVRPASPPPLLALFAFGALFAAAESQSALSFIRLRGPFAKAATKSDNRKHNKCEEEANDETEQQKYFSHRVWM